MSRSVDRAGMNQPTRTRLLEVDVDELEALVKSELAAMRKLMTGLLVAVTSASVLLAINVLVIGGGK